MKKFLLLMIVFISILLVNSSYSQQMSSKDLTVAVSAEVGKDPQPFIKLKWNKSGYAKSFQIVKKLKNDTYFPANPVANLDSNTFEWTDLNVEAGKTYEYGIQASSRKYVVVDSNNKGDIVFIATGYILSGIEVIPELNPGVCLLLIDSTMAEPLATEIDIFKKDLEAEGWQLISKIAPRAETFNSAKVMETKKIITDTYFNYPNLKSIILLGRVPVPYSGNLAPDGHGDHVGAWPADMFYGTSDNLIWSDNTINATSASRQENKNSIGDGKFDISTLTSLTNVSFAVGRIDLFDMPMFHDSTKANPEAELLRKYLNRNHLFRTNQLDIEWKGVIDDNFGAQSYPEAFAASGWRAFTNFFPYDSVKAADYITTLQKNTYLWSYGCGGGSFMSSGGIGSTSDFVKNKNNGLFTFLFGSYFGDWDIRNNFLRAPLASDPGALTIGWSGRPHWFMHHMNLAEPIGTSLLATQNNAALYYSCIYYNAQYPNGVNYSIGNRQIHISLLGDPTLKMFNNSVGMPQDLKLSQFQNNNVKLSWKAPVESGNYYYAVYRKQGSGTVTLLTLKPTSSLDYTDNLTSLGKRTYFVKALKLGASRSGSFYYSSNPISSDIDVVGVEDEVNTSFTLFPNPTSELLNVNFIASATQSTLEISDLEGNLINSFLFESTNGLTNQLVWNLTDFNGNKVAPGVYFIKLSSGTSVNLEKVIIH